MKRTNVRRIRRTGFTLIELLIVLAILVGLMALVAPRILGSRERAEINTAKSQIGLIEAALEKYEFDTRGLPATDQGLSRFDSEVFTLERSLQVMLGARPGTTLVGLLTVSPEVFDQVAEVRIAPETLERLRAWRARFGLAIDNALNFLNNPDGIQGHDFSTQIANVDERRVLQGRLTLVRYNNEPQFFLADAHVFYGLMADVLEQLGPYTTDDTVDEETLLRLRESLDRIDRRLDARGR